MARGRIAFPCWLAAAVCIWAWAGTARAATDESSLRQQLLELNNVTGTDPIEGNIRALVAKPAETKKLLPVASAMLKEKDKPLNFNALYILARTAQELKEMDASEAFYHAAAEQAIQLQSGQKLLRAYFGLMALIDSLYREKKFQESARLSQGVLELLEKQGVKSPLGWDIRRRLIRALARQGKYDEANRMLDSLLKVRGKDWRNLELKGWLQREVGKNDEAAKTYEDLLQRVGQEDSLENDEKGDILAEVRYILSGIYVDLNQIDKASAHLQVLLKENPDNPTYNNDLGYIWADHDLKLDEAEKLIRKAIDQHRKQREKLKKKNELEPEADKDNASFLDSLGWVLYKKKQYEQAKKYLLEAAKDKDEGQHLEIYEHLGDVHLALGQKAEAVAAWKKGIELAGPSKRDQQRKAEVEKKIKANQ